MKIVVNIIHKTILASLLVIFVASIPTTNSFYLDLEKIEGNTVTSNDLDLSIEMIRNDQLISGDSMGSELIKVKNTGDTPLLIDQSYQSLGENNLEACSGYDLNIRYLDQSVYANDLNGFHYVSNLALEPEEERIYEYVFEMNSSDPKKCEFQAVFSSIKEDAGFEDTEKVDIVVNPVVEVATTPSLSPTLTPTPTISEEVLAE